MILSFLKKLHVAAAVMLSGIMAVATACSDDADEYAAEGPGYVQFKVYKSQPDNKALSTRATGNMLDSLAQAHKLQVVLQDDKSVITHTVALESYSSDNSEFGLRSDKLELMSGNYTFIGYHLFDKAEKKIYSGEPAQKTIFNIQKGGLTMQPLYVNSVLRGSVKFILTKDIQLNKAAASEDNSYPFHTIGRASVTIRNTATKATYNFENVKADYRENYTMKDGKSYTSAVCEIDTVLKVDAGTYEVVSYVTSTRMGSTLATIFADKGERIGDTFVVLDNELTEAQVPVTIRQADAHIKDYIALKKIWEALDGPNWSFRGEGFDAGTNWNFNKDIDLWGIQPGVNINAQGRVTSLNIGDFCPKGFVPDALGELTELVILSLGTHNDKLGGVLPGYPVDGNAQDLKNFRDDYYLRAVYSDPRSQLSPEMQMALEVNGIKINKKAEMQKKDVAFGEYSNLITGITDQIGNLTKLEQFYVANGLVTAIPASIGNLEELRDVEVYNCPKMTSFPTALAGIKNLQALNIAQNKQWDAAQLKAGLEALSNGPAGKEIQILYMGFNNLEELPADMSKMTKLGKLDCTNNKIKKLNPLGEEVNLVQISMDHNEITEIPANFCGVADVESYNFSYNKIKKFPNIFNAMSKYVMSAVDFSNNEIDGFDGCDENGNIIDFKGVNASTVNLAYNKLKFFPGCLFHTNSPVSVLQLNSNEIEKISNEDLEGSYMYMITTLDLSNNKLKALPSKFEARSFPYLYGLDLSYNRFDYMPMVQFNISGLTTFSFRYQRDEHGNRCMKQWPTGIWKHNGLRALLLGGNDIRKIDDTETISYLIRILEVADNPDIYINVKDVCPYIQQGSYRLIYDASQNIVGCDYLDLDN